jgi:hypothetical protein
VPRPKKQSENHAVQNTSERVSHHLPYAAKSYEASETRELYVARDHKASEEKLCMKPTKHEASERKRTLKIVYKRLKAGEKKKDEARSEEATQSDQQQQCI